MRRGRSRGIGVTLISQRSAAVSKGVLTRADVLIMLRTTASTTASHDQRAIGEWIQTKGVSEQRESVLTGLWTLPPVPPGYGRRRWTYCTRSTSAAAAPSTPPLPKLGQTLITPTAFVDIDLAAH